MDRCYVLDQLHISSFSDSTEIILVSSRDELASYTGRRAGGTALVTENKIIYVYSKEGNPPVRHELAHLYSWQNWGYPAGYWLSEGAAVYGVGDCDGINLHAWAAHLLMTSQLIPFEDLEKNFDFSSAASHLQAGSFVKFLAEEYGITVLRNFWKKGLEGAVEVTGISGKQLINVWMKNIQKEEFVTLANDVSLRRRMRCE